jgi:hypothetical protein
MSVEEYEPADIGAYEIQVADLAPEEILIEEAGTQVGRIRRNDGVMDFEGEPGPSADVVMLIVFKGRGKKEDGSYYSISFAPGGWDERGGVTLWPDVYPNIEGPCTPAMREFVAVLNTLIIRSCDAYVQRPVG